MIGWPDSWKCAVACRFGELSQQPMWPQVSHMRRCTQLPPIFRQSSQPGIDVGSSVTSTWPRCVHWALTALVLQEVLGSWKTVHDLLAEARDGLERLSPAAAWTAAADGAVLVDVRDSAQR